VYARKDGSNHRDHGREPTARPLQFRRQARPRHYTRRIRAVGYGTRRQASADIAAGSARPRPQLTRKRKHLGQLTNAEWLDMRAPARRAERRAVQWLSFTRSRDRQIDPLTLRIVQTLGAHGHFRQSKVPTRRRSGCAGGSWRRSGEERRRCSRTRRVARQASISARVRLGISVKTCGARRGRATQVLAPNTDLPRPLIEPHGRVLDKDATPGTRIRRSRISASRHQDGKVTEIYPARDQERWPQRQPRPARPDKDATSGRMMTRRDRPTSITKTEKLNHLSAAA